MAKQCEQVLSLTFLLYSCEESPGRVVAHCLELDVVAVEDTKPGAILLLKELIDEMLEAAMADGTLEKVFRLAPREYWQKLVHARPYRASARVEARRIASPLVKRVDYAVAT